MNRLSHMLIVGVYEGLNSGLTDILRNVPGEFVVRKLKPHETADILVLGEMRAERSVFPLSVPIRCETAILPGSIPADAARLIQAQNIVTYGRSPRDTVTISSACDGLALAVLRGIKTLDGDLFEPQELIIRNPGSADCESLLAAVACAIVTGAVSPERPFGPSR